MQVEGIVYNSFNLGLATRASPNLAETNLWNWQFISSFRISHNNHPTNHNTFLARQETPLHYAAIRGNAEMIQLLLDAKADMQMESKYGENPCDVAGQGVAAFLQSHDSSEVTTLLHGNYLKWRESRTAQDLSPWGQKMVCTRWGIAFERVLVCYVFMTFSKITSSFATIFCIWKVRQLIGL